MPGLYVHIPFCLRKCHYCDFVSYPNMENSIDEYIDALLTEAKLNDAFFSSRRIDTVFIGGGTPSLLSPSQIERLVCGLQSLPNFNPTEFTIESNPETITDTKLAAYANAGINRLSIGLQCHDNDILRAIGRGHTYQNFLTAYKLAANHFDNINVDTIFGLPNQTLESFRETLRQLIELSPTHISSYSLKLEQGTNLYSSFYGIDDETDREMYHTAIEMLSDTGYFHYETSNFSQQGFECKHNMKYWTGEEYLGLGVAAHSYYDGNTRTNNTDNLMQYIQMLSNGEKPTVNTITLSNADMLEDYIMLHLRLVEGIVFDDFYNKFNTSFQNEYADAITFAKDAGLITITDSSVHPTIKGFDLQNTLISEFMKKM